MLSNPSYQGAVTRASDLADRLRRFCASGNHTFWPDTVSLLDRRRFDLALVGSHRHLTDVHLLGLAHKMRGCLATFDRSIPLKAVVGAKPSTLEAIAAVDDERG